MRTLALFLLLAASAQGAMNTGASFLKLDPAARPAALGGAYTAASGTTDTLFFNPSGLAGLGKRELSAGHAEWVAGTRFAALAFGQPTKWGAFGLGVVRLGAGDFEARAADRRAAGGFTAADSIYALSAARNFPSAKAALGMSVKFLQSEIGPYSAQTVAVDLGARREIPGRPISLGFSILNLGKGLKFLDQEDALPLTVAAGATLHVSGVLGISLDLRHEPNDSRTSIAVGTEYAFMGNLALRAGYGAANLKRDAGKGPLGGLGAGLGFRLRSFGADYAFTPFGELGDVQRLSLSARF